MNQAKCDFVIGLILMAGSLGLQIVSVWLWMVALLAGMNLAIGNLRHVYGSLRRFYEKQHVEKPSIPK